MLFSFLKSYASIKTFLMFFAFFLLFAHKSFVYGNNSSTPVHELPQKFFQERVEGKKNWVSHAVIGIITASNRLRAQSDLIAERLLKTNGYEVKSSLLIKNLEITDALNQMLMDPSINVILCIGGTGISSQDVTIEAVNQFIQKPLPGFGELFRSLTYEQTKHLTSQIGILSLDTRATAGVYKNVLIFAIPGSPHATTLAIEKIIIPGLPTLLRQLTKE
ncbi:MAG: hypothetical protein JSS34_00305 [Proteobacteria bacterium]|nr:hypothetical protein [Pseudomonadota bacterium]